MKGETAEQIAAAFLLNRGLKIIHRNYRCRFGEIDLVAQDGKTLVFVEVKSRRTEDFGGAAASITHGKREKLLRAARHYLAQARSSVTSRQVSPAVSTSALNASSSVWPCHSAVSASSKSCRRLPDAAAAGGRRPNS